MASGVTLDGGGELTVTLDAPTINITAANTGPQGPSGPEGPQGPPGVSNSIYSGTWRWTTGLSDASTSGDVGLNAATWATATEVHLSKTTRLGSDVSLSIGKLKIGDDLYLKDKADADKWGRYTIAAAAVDHGDWVSYSVTFVAAAEPTPANNADAEVALLVEGAQAEQWLSGAGPPAGTDGRVGDWYLDETSGAVYEKTAETIWTLRADLTGPQGPPGPSASTTDLTLVADSDANGTGDLILKTGIHEQGRLANAGGLTLQPPANTPTLTAKAFADAPTQTQDSFRAGPGSQYGPPPSSRGGVTFQAVDSTIVGNLTGTYQYAYTETDNDGETTPSAAVTVTVSGRQVDIDMPLPRRGINGRKLYRTTGGGTQLKLALDLSDGGNDFFITQWRDNVPDAALGTNAPTSDTTAKWSLQVREGPKYFRTFPSQGTGPSDFALLTADPITSGAYASDIYGEVITRIRNGHNFQAQRIGSGAGDPFIVSYIDTARLAMPATPVFPTIPAASVWRVLARGHQKITPYDDSDYALLLSPVAGATLTPLAIRVQNETTTTWAIDRLGKTYWGPGGTTAVDTALERTGVARLQIASTLDVTGLLNVGAGAIGSAAAQLLVATTGSNNMTAQFGSAQGAVRIFMSGSAATARLYTSNASSLALGTAGTDRITISGGGNIGFFGAAAAAKPTVSGSRGGNAALASLLTGLAALGLVTDSTTA